MWGDQIDVTNLDADALLARRHRLRLSQKETGRQMFSLLGMLGRGGTDEIVLGDRGLTWASEPACVRTVSELENRRRVAKEEQYVYALLAVLGLSAAEVGLAPLARPISPDEIASVRELPANIRGTMLNEHGEQLVYTDDDVLYHADCDWQGYAVTNGSAKEVVLDADEKRFVRAMWGAGRHRRKSPEA